MDDFISEKISKEWHLSSETIKEYSSYFTNQILPIIKENYLSHLVATVQDMVNNKKMSKYLKEIEQNARQGNNGTNKTSLAKLRSLLASRTFRLYSIILEPTNLKRRATTRHHPSGAIIYYNSPFDEKTIRILIAHEIGHIVNRELLDNSVDSEETANLFTYIALEDKNKYYKEECRRFTDESDIEIFNNIFNVCPIKNKSTP